MNNIWWHPTGDTWELCDDDGHTVAEIQSLAPGWYTYYIHSTDSHGGATSLAEAKEICEACV